jgi:indolepyruvate ferredoxin oxidoreductase
VQLAGLALDIKGFGHVKLKNFEAAKEKEAKLLGDLRNPSPAPVLKAAE